MSDFVASSPQSKFSGRFRPLWNTLGYLAWQLCQRSVGGALPQMVLCHPPPRKTTPETDRKALVGTYPTRSPRPILPGTSPRTHPGRDCLRYESIGPLECVHDDDEDSDDEHSDDEAYADGGDNASFLPIGDYDSEDDFDRPGPADDDDKPATIVLPRPLPRPTTTSQKPTDACKDAHR